MMKSSAFKLFLVAACLTAASRVSAQDSTAEETQQTGFAWDNSGDPNSSSTSSTSATGTSGSSSGSSSSAGNNGNGGNARHWHGGGGNNVPLDAGLSFLLIAGAGVGVKKMLGNKSRNK